jgi:hypothetical protein
MSVAAALSSDALEGLRWLHVNLVQSCGVPLSPQQLLQLEHAVGNDAVRVRRRVAVAVPGAP